MAKDREQQGREVSRLPINAPTSAEGSAAPSASPVPALSTPASIAEVSPVSVYRVSLKGVRPRKVDAQGRVFNADYLDVGAIGPGDARLIFERYNGMHSTQSQWVVEMQPQGTPAEVWLDPEFGTIRTAWDGVVQELRAARLAEKSAKRGTMLPQAMTRQVEQHVAAAMAGR